MFAHADLDKLPNACINSMDWLVGGGFNAMAEYEYGRIRTLAHCLANAGIDMDIAAQILAGGEQIRKSTAAERKAEWMRHAMERMDALLDAETRQAVRESCACCLGGIRLKMSTAIAKAHRTLEERIAAANNTPFVFGHSVSLEADGRVLVRFAPDNLEHYQCVCLRKAVEPISATYCYCCGGHVKHHLQIALGRKLSCTMRSSALCSGGMQPCTFLFDINK